MFRLFMQLGGLSAGETVFWAKLRPYSVEDPPIQVGSDIRLDLISGSIVQMVSGNINPDLPSPGTYLDGKYLVELYGDDGGSPGTFLDLPLEVEIVDGADCQIVDRVLDVSVTVDSLGSNALAQFQAAVIANKAKIPGPSMCDMFITQSDHWLEAIESLGDISDRSGMSLMIKSSLADSDDDALVWLDEGVGLVRLNGALATSSEGSFVVTDAVLGNISVMLKGTSTALLQVTGSAPAYFAVKVFRASGVVAQTLRKGRVSITYGVIQKVS
jgi:hypothetical protein